MNLEFRQKLKDQIFGLYFEVFVAVTDLLMFKLHSIYCTSVRDWILEKIFDFE